MNKPLDPAKKPSIPVRDIVLQAPTSVLLFSLVGGQGPGETKKLFKLHKKRAVIGSALSSDIRVQQGSVSNVHAVVEVDEQNQVNLYDMASESGVYVNGEKVVSKLLKSGDKIKVGDSVLEFSMETLQEVAKKIPKFAAHKTAGAQRLFVNEQEDFRPLILEDERNVIEIFDYPSNGQLALQVAQYWDSVILDVRHYSEQRDLSLGEDPSADFLVPDFANAFPFISFENDECVLSFTEDMRGVVRSKQRLATIEEIRAERGSAGAFRLPLKATDFVKLQVKGITFFISFTPVPPHLRRQRVLERDPFFLRIWITSLLLSGLLIFSTTQIPAPPKPEAAEVPTRVATIIFQPVKKPKPPVVETPKVEVAPPSTTPPTPKPSKPTEKTPKAPVKAGPKNPISTKTPPKPAGGDAGAGVRAAGREGSKGQPNKPKGPVHSQTAKGTPNAAATAKSGTNKGPVNTLANDLGGAISKSLSAGAAGVKAAASKLGMGGFTTEGSGGLGNVDKGGQGGGGESLDVAGLTTKGLGQGVAGEGVGNIGKGGNIMGTGRGRPEIDLGSAQDTIIMGGLCEEVIDEVIRKHLPQIRYCYEKEANANKQTLSGRIMARFVISGSGRVSQAGLEASSMKNANVEKCLTNTIRMMVFPEPVGGGTVEVSKPFTFTPAITN